jgi:hypothetical protein
LCLQQNSRKKGGAPSKVYWMVKVVNGAVIPILEVT